MEATGRLKIKLARRALALSEDCADAYVILTEATSSPEEARDWYQRGVDAGARALGPERWAALAGEFWGHLETRPYMRARLGLAQILHELGQEDVALDHYRELLRLNPNDNQGVRYLLLPVPASQPIKQLFINTLQGIISKRGTDREATCPGRPPRLERVRASKHCRQAWTRTPDQ